MKVREATNKRVQELRKERRLSEYILVYQATMPPPIVKNILHGKSTNPGIVNIKKIAGGLSVTIREFYDPKIFDDLGQKDWLLNGF